MPGWMRWTVGLCLAAGYSFLFYFLFVAPTGFRWRAIYGDPDYPEGYTIYGIDVSRYQGTINWNRLRNAMIDRLPIRFIIIKSTEGDSHVDMKFRDNFYNAKESGFIRGAYHSGVIILLRADKLISSWLWFILSQEICLLYLMLSTNRRILVRKSSNRTFLHGCI